jgi:hypothetical protein
MYLRSHRAVARPFWKLFVGLPMAIQAHILFGLLGVEGASTMRLVCKSFYRKFKIQPSLEYVTMTIAMTTSFFLRMSDVLFVTICGEYFLFNDVIDQNNMIDRLLSAFISTKLSSDSDEKIMTIDCFFATQNAYYFNNMCYHFDQLVPKLVQNMIRYLGTGKYYRRFNVYHILELNIATDAHIVWRVMNGIHQKVIYLEIIGLRCPSV